MIATSELVTLSVCPAVGQRCCVNEEEEVTASQRTERLTHVSSLPSPSSFSTTRAALGDVFFENTLRGNKGYGAHGSEWTRDRSVRSEERSQEGAERTRKRE